MFDKTVAPMASDRLKAALVGLGQGLYAPIGFLSPLVVIVVMAEPQTSRAAPMR